MPSSTHARRSAEEYGIVGYTHAGGADRPLVAYTPMGGNAGAVVVPHMNWRGLFSLGTAPSGANSTVPNDSGNSSSPGSGNGGGDDNTGPFGAIEPMIEPYDEAAVDWNPTPEGSMRVVDDDEPCDRYHAAFTFALSIVQNARIPYNPLSTNSNATVRYMLETAQIKYGKPPVWAPGWNTNLF